MTKDLEINFEPVWEHIDRAFHGAMRESMELARREVVLEIEKQDLQVSGDLKKSITGVVKNNIATLGSNMPYAVYVHEGTRPHWAPLNPLRLWVQMKTGLKGDEVEKRARQVQASIARKGTKPHPFFRNAIERWQKKLPQILRDLTAKRLGK